MTLHNTYVNFHPKKFCFVVSNFQKALKDTLPMIVPQKSKIDSSFFTVHDEKQLIIFNQPSQSVTKY